MGEIAIIGGTGLTSLTSLELAHRHVVPTPYGEPSGALTHGRLHGREVVFLARHGEGHTLPPHRVNYRANLWALHSVGVRRVIAVAAVGGIRDDMTPGRVAFPDQIIDYTWGRAHTFVEGGQEDPVRHVDFTRPYDATLRGALIDAARAAGVNAVEEGTYGATQGPRLESAAEIERMARDGCDLVGMTGMPEAVLARELDLHYATCAVVANWAAGRHGEAIDMDAVEHHLRDGIAEVDRLLERVLSTL